ncbi:MAG: reverse transcriptase/maturase family protein [Candidatus Woesearchaeota archaeon]|nr:reverse transcriptase/maturase family protein [Candidatus Woesearchaeota archaeon]
MKTRKNLFEKICSFENLHFAFQKARRGKNSINEVLLYNYNLERNLIKLQKQLQNQAYKTGHYRNFTIFEPKKREISALPFKDRIVHHAVCNIIEPIFEKTFINDSYACRKNKGTHAGANKLQHFLRKNSKMAFALKCDVKHYFPSVDCKLLKQEFGKKIACKKTLALLDLTVDSLGKEKGIPIGNLTSQLFANIYLNKLDQFAKHELKAKHYVRYMDDFIILHEKKTQLQAWKKQIREFLNSLQLELSEKKANVFPVKAGVDFLGYKLFAFHKLVRKITVKRFLRKIKAKIKSQIVGEIVFEKLAESFNSWEAYLTHASTLGLKKSIYRSCFKNAF